MKPLFHCEFGYSSEPHLSQLFVGLDILQKKRIITCSIKKNIKKSAGSLFITLDKKYTVVFDMLDGFNWLDGTEEEKLNQFKNRTNVDFYFKRSYSDILQDYCSKGCKLYPYGLNYYLDDGVFYKGVKNTFKNIIKNISFLREILKLGKEDFSYHSFESYPTPQNLTKILFLTRLWDPDTISSKFLKEERTEINNNRINAIKACKKEFKNLFLGGLIAENFSLKNYPEIIIPYQLTNKSSYIQQVKEHNICIATTGLHNSIGWKFAEYVASSRCILSEPLHYSITGDFRENKNYLSFTNAEELLEKIYFLFDNKNVISEIMQNNFHYYNNYVRPDNIVLNALLTVYTEIHQPSILV
jgi:hypothetical protein